MNKNYTPEINFFNRRSINLDITHRCALECPRCQRYRYYTIHGKKVPGVDMSLENIKKIISFFKIITFCGQYSDAVHHPKFIEILKLLHDNEIWCGVHNASSAKPLNWYIKAFNSHPTAEWVFGIDGLPEESHKYRINQDGKKLFNIMLESKKYLKKRPTWQYIIFNYNENNIEKAKKIANANDVNFMTINSSRWLSKTDPMRPINPKLSFDPK